MTQSKVQEFFRQKKVNAGDKVDWEARKLAWIETINRFYQKINGYLGESIKSGDIEISLSPKKLVEEDIGPYEVNELLLRVGNERVVFSPKGRNIVGAAGRIDLVGERGRKTLVVQPDERWCVIESRTPSLKLVPLDENSLVDVLKEIMRK